MSVQYARAELRVLPENAQRSAHFPRSSFDFVYSNIVLQHMEPRYSRAYMDSGFRARVTGDPATIHAVGGSQVSVPVTIQNVSKCARLSVGDREQKYDVVKLCNRWLTPQGKHMVWDDGRQPLPYDLCPNVGIQTAVLSAGKYILELDVVHEAAAWFNHKSSTPDWVQAVIEPAPMPVAAAVAGAPPRVEMHGVEKDEVIDVLTSSRARVLDIVADDSAGPEWIGLMVCGF